MTAVKICGLRDTKNLRVAAQNGADFAGFVFYPPSPRNITPKDAAKIIEPLSLDIQCVGVFVDPSDRALQETLAAVPLDFVQLHGRETPARVRDIKEKFGKPVIKAIAIAAPEDLENVAVYEEIADWFLFDTKPADDSVAGGTGQVFDWRILENLDTRKPWMLSGGLTKTNAGEALSMLKPDALDVSSSLEDEPGQKNPDKIIKFINTVKTGV